MVDVMTDCPNCGHKELDWAGETTGNSSLWCPECGTLIFSEDDYFIPYIAQERKA